MTAVVEIVDAPDSRGDSSGDMTDRIAAIAIDDDKVRLLTADHTRPSGLVIAGLYSPPTEAIKIIALDERPLQTPEAFFRQVSTFFQGQEKCQAFALSCFGPFDLDPSEMTPGHILSNSSGHPAWGKGTDVLGGTIANSGGKLPAERFALATDAGAGALGVHSDHSPRSSNRTTAYVSVGSGISVSMVMNGTIWQGRHHPEMGHIPVRPFPGQLPASTCSYHHGYCLNGLASLPALLKRSNVASINELMEDVANPIWDEEAYYLAQLCLVLVRMLMPTHIRLGGALFTDMPEPLRKLLLHRVRGYLLGVLGKGFPVERALPNLTEVIDVTPLGIAGLPVNLAGTLALASRLTFRDGVHPGFSKGRA